jgi:hypothetical protein
LTDNFYTPISVCQKMIDASCSKKRAIVADFAAGSGELLKAAVRVWPAAQIFATDIRASAIRMLKKNAGWSVGQCDFLNETSRGRCLALKEIKSKVSLILLNPPFSYRGGTYWTVSISGCEIRCSKAMAFLLRSIEYLAPGGEIIAIVPTGAIHSERDRKAWDLIRTIFSVDVIASNGDRAFSGCVTTTCIVRLQTRNDQYLPPPALHEPASQASITLFRGKIQMHTVPKRRPQKSIRLVHTTSLRGFQLHHSAHRVAWKERRRAISGPVILFPRVGMPDRSKLVFYKHKGSIVLSDCIFALKADLAALMRLYEKLLENWARLERLYRGTGAKYLTGSDVANVLGCLGFSLRPADGKNHQLLRALKSRQLEFS